MFGIPYPRRRLLLRRLSLPNVTLPGPLHRERADIVREEDELVRRVREGHEEAFNELYLRYHERLWKFAYGYVRSIEVAEELVQDVFLTVWSRRAQWHIETHAGAWLFGAVRNRALNHLRHERVSVRAFSGASGEAAMESTMGTRPAGAQELVEARELELDASRALAGLSERTRAAMTLRWKHDMSSAEIAEALNATPGAVRVLLTRARQELATLLGRSR